MLIELEMAFDCPFFPFHGIGNLNAKLMLKINYFHSSLNRLDKAVLVPNDILCDLVRLIDLATS